MSTLWSKILETFVADFTMAETKNYWKGTQHGGIKGSSTEHVLIDTWDRILKSLETSRNSKAVLLTALDFSKSFSWCTHEEILRSYARLNASQWLIDIHRAFLIDRIMVVKVGTKISKQRKVTGGAVQGSVLGILDHNAVLENLDDNLLHIYTAKYVDDITLVETVSKEIAVDESVRYNSLCYVFNPPYTQIALNTIVQKATLNL